MAKKRKKTRKPFIRIVSKKAGFRRAGMEHPDSPREYRTAEFNDEQLEMLEREPMLVITYHDEPEDEPEDTEEGSSSGEEETE